LYKGSAVLECVMSEEKTIRLNEVDLLETYLNQNQIENGPIRNYVSHRRTAIEVDFADPSEAAQGEGENQNSALPQDGDQGVGSSEQQPATETAQGEGTQSPTPDAANQPPIATV
jgi:hypothetical protein